MEIKLNSHDRLRLSVFKSRSFIDVECAKDETCVSAESYTMHKIEIRKKANVIKMFSFPNDYPINEFDFGWWNDADIIWTNFPSAVGV